MPSAAEIARAKLEAQEAGQQPITAQPTTPPTNQVITPVTASPPPQELGRSPAEIARQRLETQEQAITPQQPQETFGQQVIGDWKREAQAAGQGVAQGAATIGAGFGIPGLLGTASNWAFGTPKLPYPGDYLGVLARHGLYDPNFQPQSFPEQLSQDLGAAAPSMSLGPLANTLAPWLERGAYTFAPAAAGTVLNTAGVPNWLTGPALSLPMSGGQKMIGDWRESRAAAKAEKEATAALNEHQLAQPGFERQMTAEREGAAAVSKGSKIATEADISKWHDSEHVSADTDREAVASQLGNSKTLEGGAGVMQDKARTWMTDEFKPQLGAAEDAMYYKDPLDHSKGTLIPQSALGDATHLKSSIEHPFTGGGEDAQPITSLFRSRLPEQVNAKLDLLAKEQGKPEGTAPQFSFDDQRAIRSAIGDALNDPSIVSSIGTKKLNEMYRGINDDIRANIENVAGQEGLDRFDKFNKEATRLFGVAGTVGDNIITTTNAGKETITPYQVGNKDSLWNDSTKVNQLRSEPTLNQGVDEVAAGKLRSGGRDAETAYDNSPEGKTAMYGNQVPALDAIKAKRAWADQTKDSVMQAAKDRSLQILQKEKTLKGDQVQENKETGEQLKQTAEAATARSKASNDPLVRLLHIAKSWPEAISAAGGWFGAGHWQPWANKEAANIGESWTRHALSPAGAIASGLGVAGARQLIDNPNARTNLLRATSATMPSIWAPTRNPNNPNAPMQ